MSRDTFVIPSAFPGPSTIEGVDQVTDAHRSYMSTPTTSPTDSSRNSLFEFADLEDDVEEIVRECEEIRRTQEHATSAHMPAASPPCRLDGAHEIAMSFFGIVVTKNFGRVMEGVYRSAFPQSHNLTFLKTLKLKTIL
jgi:hypothetical protein